MAPDAIVHGAGPAGRSGAQPGGAAGAAAPIARIHWSPPANLHITTKFIGEWPEDRLDGAEGGAGGLPERPPIEVTVARVGFFPNPRAPRVFWCGIEAPGLEALAADTDAATAALGVGAGESPVLAAPDAGAHQRTARPCSRCATPSPPPARSTSGASRRARFFLYRSQLRPAGSVYTKLAEFPFSKR